jgi:signal transduction histidine kinase
MQSLKGRILIVDDHPRNVAILKKILTPEYRLMTANSGGEALQLALGFAPELVLLDIMMPGIDGYETCRRLRLMPELASTKILMVSAKAMTQERIMGYAAGADDYIVKPFDEHELLVKIKVYMRLKKIEEVDQLKTDILMLLTHETRTPLTAILGPVELVLDDPSLSEQHRKLLRMTQDGARRLNDFVERLLFLSSLHAGLVPFDLKRQNLAPLVRQTAAALSTARQPADVTLVQHLEDPVEVEVDAEHVMRVVAALLDNAIRVSPHGGTVEVTLGAEDGYACLTVTDQGPGVAEHFLPHVFDGMRVPDTEHHNSGHGLSLVTARAIVRHHEGALRAANREQGGAVFTMRLPLASMPAQTPPASPSPSPLGAHELS